MTTTMNGSTGALSTPERNHFFYGKLMDVAQFQKEQRYFNHKRLLYNRLALGSGVVCGLHVVPDPQAADRVRILPGAALDGFGREIIVPEVVAVNPRQPTDDQGQPVGDPLLSGTVDICLAYAETCADPVPVLVPDCDTPGNCAPSTIREGFRILVRAAAGDLTAAPICQQDFPVPVPAGETLSTLLHTYLCERISAPCPEAPDEPCVPLARVSLDNGSIDAATGRQLIYSNALLYELILCLAERVNVLFGGL